ncbi:MAG: winged helix-turn-helix domain-containing protein [Desulfurococcaceae archaeon TW002]
MRTSLLNVLAKIEGEVRYDELSELVGLSKYTLRRYLRELLEEGLVIEVSKGTYALTDKGRRIKESLKSILTEVSDDKAYVVTDPGTGVPVPLRIKSLKHLYVVMKHGLAPEEVLREHLKRGYVSEWVKNVLGDEELAKKLVTEDLSGVVKVLEELISLIE